MMIETAWKAILTRAQLKSVGAEDLNQVQISPLRLFERVYNDYHCPSTFWHKYEFKVKQIEIASHQEHLIATGHYTRAEIDDTNNDPDHFWPWEFVDTVLLIAAPYTVGVHRRYPMQDPF